MEPALLKAQRSLESAARAFQRLSHSSQLNDMEDHWESMLYALAQVVKTLAPLKIDPRLTTILKAMELDRRGGEPLVTYVYEARNVKDHGVKPITIQQGPSTTLKSDGQPVHVRHLQFGGISIINSTFSGFGNLIQVDGTDQARIHGDIRSLGPGRVYVERSPAHVRLVEIHSEKTRRTYPAPKTHQGVSIPGDLLGVAELALIYYQAKFQEVVAAVKTS